MGFLATILRPQAVNVNDERYWTTWPGPLTSAGIQVSADTAMKTSAVWGCVRLISESMATLPLLIYRRRADGGRDRDDEYPLAQLLHYQPNEWQTAFEFIEMMTGHVLLRGNAYAEIVRRGGGPATALIPLHPDLVEVTALRFGGMKYKVRQSDGTSVDLRDDQVLHIRGLSSDGVKGLSVIDYARESIGLAQAAEQYGARFFGNDSRPGGVLKHPGKLQESGAKRLKESWEAAHTGVNQHRVAILEEGMEWQQIGVSPEDAQFLQIREFQVTDIARWFRVPLHMIQETTRSTSWGSGIEQLSLAFVQFTLLPWARRWEQAILRDLIMDPDVHYAEFKVDALARGDQGSRYGAYAVGRQWGWLSVNDVRQLENMNPIDNGDEYLVPLNMRDSSTPYNPGQPQGGEQPEAQEERAEEASVSKEHYDALLREAAGRVVRKELAALGRLAKRTEGDAASWQAAVTEFYANHAVWVVEVLRMPMAVAQDYCRAQEALALAGYDELVAMQQAAIDHLCNMARGGVQ